MHNFYVYILSRKSPVLYVGITNDIRHRVWEHQHDELSGFTSKYRVHRLVYFERFQYVRSAIASEKQIKGGVRQKKISLIESENPTWEDLSQSWFNGKQVLRFAQDDSSNSTNSEPGFK
jgi:putative endonuclease